MKVRTLLPRVFGVMLVVAGSQVWGSRLSFASESEIFEQLGGSMIEVNVDSVSDLTDVCNTVRTPSGWMIFVLFADLRNDDRFRTFFETAEERIGLWVEQDYGLLRLGLGLGTMSSESNTDLPIRIVRQNEKASVLIVITSNQVRVVSNNLDAQVRWPAEGFSEWSCERVQFADDTRELSEGHDCKGCNIRLFYASGDNLDELQEFLDRISNVRRFNAARITGTILILSGFLLILGFGDSLFSSARRDSSRSPSA